MNSQSPGNGINPGDRVRIDIPDETDPDYKYHGKNGKVITVIPDDAGKETGDPQDNDIYRVKIDTGETVDVRARDLRPPF